MTMIRISCPHCLFSREFPADKVPDQPVQATCPKCKQTFPFSKPVASSPTTATSGTMPPLPPPPESGPLPPPLPKATSTAGTSRMGIRRELMTVSKLFSATWQLYKQRWLVLVGLFIATAVATAAPPLLVTGIMGSLSKGSFSGTVALFMLLGLAMIGSLLVLCWGMTAVVAAAVNERLGFNDALNHAKGCWLSLAWVSTLYSFIVGGASLLFIIPGIMTGIWFFACAYLVVGENTRGMDALLKSKALVDGRFWHVTWRLVVVWLLGVVLGLVPIVGPILSLLAAPFSMLYSVVLYRNLSETAGTVRWSSSDGTKAGWLLLGLVGYLLVPLIIFTLLGAAFFSNFESLINRLKTQSRGQQVLLIKPSDAYNTRQHSVARNQAGNSSSEGSPTGS